MGKTIDFTIGEVKTTAYVSVPEAAGPLPGVVVAFHREGIDRFTEWVVDDLARNGYAAIAPNHYHALPPGMDIERRREFLTDEQMAVDLKAGADWLVAHGKAAGDRLAVLGHCMGGRTTFVGLVSWPGLFKCGCAWYSGNTFGQMGTVPPPAERLAEMAAPLAGFFGNDDKNPSPDDVNRLDQMLTELTKPHEFHRYDGAAHAFMGARRAAFREHAARDSWTKALKFMSRHIGGKAPATAAVFPQEELVG